MKYQYTVNKSEKSVLVFDIHRGQTGDDDHDIGNRQLLLWRNFLEPVPLINIDKDSIVFVKKVTINHQLCDEIYVKPNGALSPNDSPVKGTWIDVSEKDSIPLFQKWIASQNGKTHHISFKLETYQFDSVPDISLSNEIDHSFNVSYWTPDSNIDHMLDSNTWFPPLYGKMY